MAETSSKSSNWWIVAVVLLVGFALSVPAVGIVAAIAIPNFIVMQLRAKRAEVPASLEEIRIAERAWNVAYGGYVVCGSREEALLSMDNHGRDYATDPAAECFAELGWAPEHPLRGAYWTENALEGGEDRLSIYGVIDADGDGVWAEYRCVTDLPCQRVTPPDVY